MPVRRPCSLSAGAGGEIRGIAIPLHGDVGESIADFPQVLCSELDGSSTHVLLQAMQLRGAGDWDYPGLFRQQPRNRNLRLRRSLGRAEGYEPDTQFLAYRQYLGD